MNSQGYDDEMETPDISNIKKNGNQNTFHRESITFKGAHWTISKMLGKMCNSINERKSCAHKLKAIAIKESPTLNQFAKF